METETISDRNQLNVWTVGHSTRSAEEFNQILKAHQIEVLFDVRSFPGSRRYPQFNKETLAGDLRNIEIRYQHLPLLGGRRKSTSDSKNTAWQNPSFRAYADYMETASFREGIEDLLAQAAKNRAVIMCAEAVWWRCHRSLIADYLKAHGVAVIHIADATHTQVHPYTSAARIIDGNLSYEGLLSGVS